MRYLVSTMLLVVAVIHLLPLVGVLGGPRLTALYGIQLEDPNLLILMRHRAVLFGLLGVFLAFAAFRRDFQPMAFIAGGVSVLSYLCLAWVVGGYNDQVARVVTADIVAGVCIVVGAFAYVRLQREG